MNSKPVGIAFEDPQLDGAMIGKSGGTAGFFGTHPIKKAAALTASLPQIAIEAASNPNYEIGKVVDTLPFGFQTEDDGQTLMMVVKNLQTRVTELETRLQNYGLLT